MSRPWLEPAAPNAYHRLCASIVGLARAAVARLAARDGDPLDTPPAAHVGQRVAELRAAWHAAEALVPGGGPLGRLTRLLRPTESFVETVLFALIAAPALDRGVARAYAAQELDGADRAPDAVSAGLLLDLITTVEEQRYALAAALHPDAALRRGGLVRAVPAASGMATSATPLALAGSAVAVLRCEPVPLPPGATELGPPPPAGAADRALGLLGVPLLEPGQVHVLVAGETPTPATLAVARLLAASGGHALWLLGRGEHDGDGWSGSLRDAALASAITAAHASFPRERVGDMAAACAHVMGSMIALVASAPPATDDVIVVELEAAAARAAEARPTGDRAADALVAVIAAR